MTQTCPVAACFPWRLPGAEPLRPKKRGLGSSEGFRERSLLHCVFCMKVSGEEAGARFGGACTASTLGVCRGLPGTPWGMATAVADSDVHVS